MTYYTDYSIEDCIGLLSRKNIYDVFEYSFEMKTETAGEIIFTGCSKQWWRNTLSSVYMVKFGKNKKTIIDIEFMNEDSVFVNFFLRFPPKWITEFMEQKLDAVETIDGEP